MQKTPLYLANSAESISTVQSEKYAEGWLRDSEIRQQSDQAFAFRRNAYRQAMPVSCSVGLRKTVD